MPTAFAGETGGVVTVRKLLPDWAVRLLAGTLLLPALLAALDAVFRARRRRLPVGRWLAWIAAATAAPLVLAWAWARLLAVLGAFPAPPAPVLPAAVPLSWSGGARAASTVLVAALAWRFLAARPCCGGSSRRGNPAAGGAAAALGLVVTGTAAVVWVVNPYAAALLLPAAHLWLLLASPGSRRGRLAAVLAGLAGLALPALALRRLRARLRADAARRAVGGCSSPWRAGTSRSGPPRSAGCCWPASSRWSWSCARGAT